MIASFLKCKEFTYFLSNSLSDLLSGSTLLKREISFKKKERKKFPLAPLWNHENFIFYHNTFPGSWAKTSGSNMKLGVSHN